MFAFSIAFADDEMEVNDRGEVRVVEREKEKWRNFTEEEKTAYQNPGTEVPVKMFKGPVERVDFFHHVSIEKYEQVVVFRGGKLETIEKEGERRGKEKVAWYVILLFVSAFFMVISNIAVKKSVNSDAFVAFAAAFVAVAAFAAAFAFAFVAFAFAAFAFVAAFAAAFAFASDVKSRKIYIVCAALYYVAVVVAMVI